MIPRSLSSRSFRFAVPFGKFALATVSLPFFSFIFCVIWCVLYFYERSTATHCNVPNYLPSISAAIGNYQPQRFVWQMAIIVHAIPRLLIAHQYLKYNKSRVKRTRFRWVYWTFIINVIEIIALVGLSVHNSSEYYGIYPRKHASSNEVREMNKKFVLICLFRRGSQNLVHLIHRIVRVVYGAFVLSHSVFTKDV